MRADSIVVNPRNFNLVEEFVEQLCAAQQVENTYYANMLTALREVFDYYLIRHKLADELRINIDLNPEGTLFITRLINTQTEGYTDIPESEQLHFNELCFVLESLTDQLKVLERGNTLAMLFNTNGFFTTMTKRRVQQLQAYFKKDLSTVRGSNDYV
ncbi:MAG: hypothetical protein KGZ82_15270 [Bacteroidales bacterium]|nr:hypothetical protein [Bacteroidales bacterium]